MSAVTAEVVDLDDERRDRLLMRRHQLRMLRDRVEAELLAVEEELDPSWARRERRRRKVNETARAYRARMREENGAAVGSTSEACGSERGYHWHRTHGPWPLPADDPCGCRAAHAEHVRTSKRS